MGPRDVKNGFDEMFDFNRDGQLDAGEEAMQFMYMDQEYRELNGLDEDYDEIEDDFEEEDFEEEDFDDDYDDFDDSCGED